MRNLLVISLLLAVLAGCKTEEKEECVFRPEAPQKVSITLEPLQDSLLNVTSQSELVAFLTRHPVVRDVMLSRAHYPGDSAFIKEMFRRFTDPNLDTLLQETRRVFGDLSGLRSEFEEAFTNLKYYYPDFTPPKIQTVVSGLNTDLFITDTLIIVGLDYYLGKDGKYRPKTYDYLLRKYDPEDIVPSCLLIYGIQGPRNKTNIADRTVLADMIAYGKSFYFAKHMLPCIPDSTLIWYTPSEISGSRKNQDLIWARFIQDQVLFSTSHKEKQHYLGDRPATIQVGVNCPGRIGQWLGWQIVKAYMASHPETTLPQLMAIEDAQRLFKESGYRPR